MAAVKRRDVAVKEGMRRQCCACLGRQRDGGRLVHVGNQYYLNHDEAYCRTFGASETCVVRNGVLHAYKSDVCPK